MSSTKQTLQYLVSQDIYRLERRSTDLKMAIPKYWSVCDPTDESTRLYFKSLNALKSELRQIKLRIKKLAAISKSLKQQADSLP